MHVHPDLIEELMIFFKALLFYLPRCLWKSFEGGLMETFGRYCSFCPRPRVLYFCTQFLPLCLFCSRSTVIGIFTLLLLPIKSFMTFFDMSVKPKRSLLLAKETRWKKNHKMHAFSIYFLFFQFEKFYFSQTTFLSNAWCCYCNVIEWIKPCVKAMQPRYQSFFRIFSPKSK